MKYARNPAVSSLLWLLFCALVTWSLCSWLLGPQGAIAVWKQQSLYLHDTYYTGSETPLIIAIFVWVTFGVFAFKELFHRYARFWPDLIILISGLCLIVMTGWVLPFSMFFGSGGFTTYPPLAKMTPQVNSEPMISMADIVLPALQLVVVLILLTVAYCLGKARKAR